MAYRSVLYESIEYADDTVVRFANIEYADDTVVRFANKVCFEIESKAWVI